jgi:hypothetical protein
MLGFSPKPAKKSAFEHFRIEPVGHVKRDSPQGQAWWAHWKAKTGRSPPMDKDGGWRFPTEWPVLEAMESG